MSNAKKDTTNFKITSLTKDQLKSKSKSVDDPPKRVRRKRNTPIPPTFSMDIFNPMDFYKRLDSVTCKEHIEQLEKFSFCFYKELKETFKPDIQTLKENFPNFNEVTDFFDGQVILNEMSNKWFHSRPILLTGDPGVGKTQYCKELSKILNLSFKIISCGTVSSTSVLSGLSSFWSNSKPGDIVRFMKDIDIANPIIMFDEIDKMSSLKDCDPYGCLYSLLEHDTAKKFVDEYLDFPFDLSNVNFIATANDITKIPKAILSRFKIIYIQNPTIDHMKIICKNMFNKLIEEHRLEKAIGGIDDDAINFLATESKNPRKMKELLLESFGNAARLSDRVDKIIIKKEYCTINKDLKLNKIGFTCDK